MDHINTAATAGSTIGAGLFMVGALALIFVLTHALSSALLFAWLHKFGFKFFLKSPSEQIPSFFKRYVIQATGLIVSVVAAFLLVELLKSFLSANNVFVMVAILYFLPIVISIGTIIFLTKYFAKVSLPDALKSLAIQITLYILILIPAFFMLVKLNSVNSSLQSILGLQSSISEPFPISQDIYDEYHDIVCVSLSGRGALQDIQRQLELNEIFTEKLKLNGRPSLEWVAEHAKKLQVALDTKTCP